MRIAHPKRVLLFLGKNNACPFEQWFLSLRDLVGQAIVAARIEKIRQGLESNEKALGDGVYESKIYSGPGYRIYFGKEGNAIVVLLCGGSKHRQAADIKQAKRYWLEYLESRHAKEK
jgi:putative addiction module killer protein